MEVSHVLITFVLRVRSITVHEINSLPVGHVLETLPGALRGNNYYWPHVTDGTAEAQGGREESGRSGHPSDLEGQAPAPPLTSYRRTVGKLLSSLCLMSSSTKRAQS